MRCQSCMWDSQAYVDIFWSDWGQKFHSIYPEGITLHPARLAPQPRISIASTSLKYQNLMEYDCMRDSSKRWKNNDFPHIPYYHIPEHFTSNEKKKTSSGSFFQKKLFLAVCDGFSGILCLLWSTKICEYMWSVMGSSGVRWHPSSAMPHEYARREIPWEKDSGPQFPKFNNRADAGCCSLTGFHPIQQTSHTIFWNPLLLHSPKWETHLSGHALAHPGSIAFQEQHKASTWCQTISKSSWKVFPPQPVNSQVWNMSHTGKQVGKTMGPKRQVWSTMDSWYK